MYLLLLLALTTATLCGSLLVSTFIQWARVHARVQRPELGSKAYATYSPKYPSMGYPSDSDKWLPSFRVQGCDRKTWGCSAAGVDRRHTTD
jgi:hypothetical protein